jgi:hypothetical protein
LINKKALVLGLAAGLLFATVDVLAIRLNQGGNLLIEEITNFFGALPVLLFWFPSVPEWISMGLFFIYWASVGAVVAGLVASRRIISIVSALLLLVALGISHRAAQIALYREMEEAARAHGHGGASQPKHPL